MIDWSPKKRKTGREQTEIHGIIILIQKQGSYSFELFKFHDFFHDLFKFSMTLGLVYPQIHVANVVRCSTVFSCQMAMVKNFHSFSSLGVFFNLSSSTDTNSGVHRNVCRLRCIINPLYLTQSLLCHLQELHYQTKL